MPDFARARTLAETFAASDDNDPLPLISAAYLGLDEIATRVMRHDRDELQVRPVMRRNGTRSSRWYWRRRDPGNLETIAVGQGYSRREDAITGALRANPDLTEANLDQGDA